MKSTALDEIFERAKGDRGFTPNRQETDVLAQCFGIHQLWASHGGFSEGYARTAAVVNAIAAPYLLLGDVRGFIETAKTMAKIS